jgi:hypothetical protein
LPVRGVDDKVKTTLKKTNAYWTPVMETLPLGRSSELQIRKFKKILKLDED